MRVERTKLSALLPSRNAPHDPQTWPSCVIHLWTSWNQAAARKIAVPRGNLTNIDTWPHLRKVQRSVAYSRTKILPSLQILSPFLRLIFRSPRPHRRLRQHKPSACLYVVFSISNQDLDFPWGTSGSWLPPSNVLGVDHGIVLRLYEQGLWCLVSSLSRSNLIFPARWRYGPSKSSSVTSFGLTE